MNNLLRLILGIIGLFFIGWGFLGIYDKHYTDVNSADMLFVLLLISSAMKLLED
jgi:hypothetical protein